MARGCSRYIQYRIHCARDSTATRPGHGLGELRRAHTFHARMVGHPAKHHMHLPGHEAWDQLVRAPAEQARRLVPPNQTSKTTGGACMGSHMSDDAQVSR
jgi:hypothetical protein